jgi:glycosyltransferase involved in cell wall biosynthesis
LGEKKYIVLCVCRLYWLKDLHTLAETYNMLNSERDDFVMVIAGDGPARTELESLMPGALFLGHIEGDTLSRTYASADVFLFPSSTEVLDNVTFEAMASGVVPVVANIGEAPIRVGHEVRGLLGNVKDAQSFRDQVVRLLDDENFRMRLSYAGSAFAKEHSWGRVFERFLSLYKNLISKKISAGE